MLDFEIIAVLVGIAIIIIATALLILTRRPPVIIQDKIADNESRYID